MVTTMADQAARDSLAERLARLSPGSKPLWGRMSAHQMLCHLTDSFRAGMGEKSVAAMKVPLPRVIFKFIALYVPMRWPKGLPTLPEVEQGVGGTPPADFDRDRRDLVHAIETFCSPRRNFNWAPHPLFGAMRERDWLRWGYLHVDHHLRQFGL